MLAKSAFSVYNSKEVSSVGIYDLTAFREDEKALWRNATQREVQTGNRMGEESAGAYLFELARVMQEKGIDPELSLHSFCVNLMSARSANLRTVSEDADLLMPCLRRGWKNCGGNSMRRCKLIHRDYSGIFRRVN